MEKPYQVDFGGLLLWPWSQRYMVEYVLWEHGVLRLADIVHLMTSEFGKPMATPNVWNVLAELRRRGRVVRIARGIYSHIESPLS